MPYQAGNCEARRHVLPNTAFKMIEEIAGAGTLNTIAAADNGGMMPKRRLLLN
jgi:hypothetical protein